MTSINRPKQVGIMKAKPATENLIRRLGSTCYAQPKLRGQRCRTIWLPDERLPILISSYGNVFPFFSHIQEQLAEMPRLPYDGELYVHEWTQEKINSVCNRTKNPHEESYKVCYHIFDLAQEGNQTERKECFESTIRAMYEPELGYSRQNITPNIFFVNTVEIETQTDWMNYCCEYIKAGYEGIILRSLDGHYSPLSQFASAQRPSTILKYKPSELDEYIIIGYSEGTGWASGMLGSFEVRSPDDSAQFSVGTGPELTKAKRQLWWSYRNELIGKTLIVKHEPITTKNGIPICTVAYKMKGE